MKFPLTDGEEHHSKNEAVVPVKFEKLLFRNESINMLILVLNYCFHEIFHMTDQLPMLREVSFILLIFLLRQHFKQDRHDHRCFRTQLRRFPGMLHNPAHHGLWGALAVVGSTYTYELTRGKEEFYFVFGFHFCALVALLGALVVLPAYLVLYHRRLRDISACLTLFLFTLERESMLKRLLFILFNYQVHQIGSKLCAQVALVSFISPSASIWYSYDRWPIRHAS